MLTGCFVESMTMVQSGIGVSQGRVLQSAISPAISFSVKETTGMFPIEHIIKKEKARIAKKIDLYEKKVFEGTKHGLQKTQQSVAPLKNGLNNQMDKFSDAVFKVKTFTTKNFKHKPRFSYTAR